MAGSVITSEVDFDASGKHAGLFEPLKALGEAVSEGELVGFIHHPDTPDATPDQIISLYEGMVLCKRAMAQVVRGDAVFQIAKDASSRALQPDQRGGLNHG